MQKLTQKQFIKSQTHFILWSLLQELLTPEQAMKMTAADVKKQFPKTSTYKNHETGEIRVGLSYRGVRKLVKSNPHVTLQEVKSHFGLGG